MDRLQWKSGLIATFEKRMMEEAVLPPIEINDLNQWRYRRIKLEGIFQHEKELLMTGRTFEGTAGFHVLTPLLLFDNRIVLINRGWIPEKLKERQSRPNTLISGPIRFLGILREDKKRGFFVPDNEPQNEVWLYVDTVEMAEHRKIYPVAPYFIDQIRKSGVRELPIGVSTEINLRNEHLQYAFTWFSLAIILLIIYTIYHCRPSSSV